MVNAIIEKRGGFKIIGAGGGGKSGGGSARTPVESPDSLHNTAYALILDAIGNGELEGPAHPESPLRDIFLDGTPIENDDGSLNFNDVEVEFRNGVIDQEYIPGFAASSNNTQVGIEIKTSDPWVQLITNPDLSALRVTIFAQQLVKQIESGSNIGDRVGVVVTYAIDLAESGGSFVEVLQSTFDGKTVNGYSRTHRIELPPGSNPWTVRVRRLTAHASSSAVSDSIYVQSYSEIIDGKFSYPMTALVGIKIDAEQFKSIPTRAYRWRGLKIKVPSNYDPITRTYSGIWDGTFKKAWSNNPIWVYYDILLSPLYGLGDRIDASMVDRYALYQIGAYCDEMVSDGKGGLEPRFTTNVYIQSQADALKVINDLTSVFRGMAFWDGSSITAICDQPQDAVYTFTNANVEGGKFEYTGSDISTRKTVALVSYNDPEDFGRSKVEPVEDSEGILRYGIKKTEIVAFGCNSRSQAQRIGLYALYTSRMETGGIAFTVGLESALAAPGKVVKIVDANRAGRRIGGRISQSGENYIVADHEFLAEIGAILTVNLPNGSIETRNILEIDELKITVSENFTEVPNVGAIWAVETESLIAQYAKIISVKEKDAVTYDVQAIFHHPGKFEAIDSGVRLEALPVSVIPPRTQLAPQNIQISEFYTFHQGVTKHNALISWDESPNAVAYDVQWRRDNSDWIQVPRTGVRTVELTNIFSGQYVVRVRAINSLEVPSLWANSALTELSGDVAAPPALESLSTFGEVMAIRLQWSYPDTPNIISKVELRASLNNKFEDSYFLTEVAYPAISFTVYGLSYGFEMWFWGRLIDKNGLPGDWKPLDSNFGVYGKTSVDAENIISYLEGRIGAGELAPGLIEEIQQDVASGISDEILEDITGNLTGDETLDGTWFAGDDNGNETFVGNVSVTSVINEGDYRQFKISQVLLAAINENSAAIKEVQEVFVNEFEALAQQVTILASQVGDNEAVLQQTSQALVDLDGAIKANWQIKAQVRADGRVVQAGVALGAAIGEDGSARSEILLMADTIAFLNSLDGEIHAPFVFDTVNDTVFLSSAFIKNATINSGKFTDWLESDQKGPDGETPILRINFRTGQFELNSAFEDQGRMIVTNRVIKIYDENDVLRVKLGDLSA